MGRTVDYGIDLGTTNSAIARMTAKGAEVIQVQRQNYIPSVVGVDKRGAVKVGTTAQSPAFESARNFKRVMGSDTTICLEDGEAWSPEMLSAEVLKALKAAAKLKTDDDIVDVVITVPAMFNQPQCAATNSAASLAGLNAVALLQEPIAAATAYLSENPVEGYYLVYDLGGGTFDVSLIRLRSGEMNVIEHGGDNFLGGTDLDRAIFDWVLDQIDRKGGDTKQFLKGPNRQVLIAHCEEARVSLSDQDNTTIYLDEFELPLSKIELTQQQLSDIIEPYVSRTIEIARDRLKAVPKSGSVRGILLVGGPTQTPYIRTRLKAELQLPLNLDQDPMTVVARGAAIHASSILRPTTDVKPSVGSLQIELFYDPISPDPRTVVGGKVTSPVPFSGEVRLSNFAGDWETGWKALINGAFSAEVLLGRQQVSEFAIQIRDLQGRFIPCEPSSFSIRSGVRAAQPVAPYSYGVVLEGGQDIGMIVMQGTPLPASGSATFALSRTIIAGSPDKATIYFIEGNSSHADDNAKVGHLDIKGTDIHRTLKENEKVEIRIRMDESRLLKGKVYIPVLDKDYEVQLNELLVNPDLADLDKSIRETKTIASQLEDYVTDDEQSLVIRVNRQTEQLEAKLENALKGDIEEAAAIQHHLSESKASIRPLQQKYAVTMKHQRAIARIDGAEALCQRFNDTLGTAKLQDLRSEADRSLRLEQEKALDGIYDRALDVFWEHYGKTKECWEYQIVVMKECARSASDSLSYFELVRKAEQCLAENDFAGVSICQRRSWELVPDAELTERRFSDASLRKM